MGLSAGARFGPYEVVDLLGAGGMGEVYRARDTRLKRDVAIKVLPDGFATDPERLARFHREAELLASLNHPNIAAIYGLEQADAVTALVLELIEGETLADRLARGPVRFSEAMAIARQLVEALDAAHGKGVIHRDLKPANIKITPDDKVKVLDFGLAAVVQNSGVHDVNVTHSPTLTLGATRAGVILGTAAYMSPEQATGSPADKRADVWAFGVVLWEMLTARRIFEGETVSHTLAFVITKDPDWNALPANTPPSIRRLLRRCLEKDRKRRLPDIASAQMEIDDALTTSGPDAVVSHTAPPTSSSRWLRALPWAFATVATIALAVVVALWAPWRTAPSIAAVRVSGELGIAASLGTGGAPGTSLALSPDGRLLAFVAAASASGLTRLHIRRMDQLEATALSGTENARDPFFSPNGEWLAFFADGKLKKVSVTGGAAVVICDAPAGRGGWWGDDGTIALVPDSTPDMRIFRVSADGGTPVPVTTREKGDFLHRWPQSLEGGRKILFTVATNAGSFDSANIVVEAPQEATRKVVHRGGYFARYLPSGHLMYVSGGTVFVVAFDLERLEVTGQPVPVIQGVEATTGTGAVQLAVSANGTLVYLPGGERTIESPIMWMDSSGRTTPLREMDSDWSNPSFSPDGNHLAMDVVTSTGRPDVWTHDVARGTSSKLTFHPGVDVKPVWTPDGKRLVFASGQGGGSNNLFWQIADGSRPAERLAESTGTQLPGSWHPNGKLLAFAQQNPNTQSDILMLPVNGDEVSGWKIGKPTAFLNGPSIEEDPMFSPDGRWLAYTSNESGQQQVYVRSFPGPGGLQQISNDGGAFPSWSESRSELFFRDPNTQQIMVTSFTAAGQSFRADRPRVWSQGLSLARPRLRPYALHPDGKRVAVASRSDPQTTARADRVVFVFNFLDEIRRLAPPSK
jgi:Tol biopolymer transport system component